MWEVKLWQGSMRRLRAQNLLDLSMATAFGDKTEWIKRVSKEAIEGLDPAKPQHRPLGKTREDVIRKLQLLGQKPTEEKIERYLAKAS